MAHNQFYLINGDIKPDSQLADLSLNWIRNTGSSLHFTWRASGTRIPFYSQQYKILASHMNKVSAKLNPLPSEPVLKLQIEKLIQKNRLFKGIEIQIIIRFSINTENILGADYLLITDPHPNENFQMNRQGLMMGLISSGYHPGPEMMPYLDQSHPLRLKWLAEAGVNNFDTACLLNREGMLVEGTDASIFLVGKSKIYTPELSMGCTQRAIRQEILKIIRQLGYKGIETAALEPGHLKQADEVFIADDRNGIRWVMGFDNKRYYRKLSQKVLEMINAGWAAID